MIDRQNRRPIIYFSLSIPAAARPGSALRGACRGALGEAAVRSPSAPTGAHCAGEQAFAESSPSDD
jgi:hypothetical protein